ncbi:hypothetical protein CH310_15100 [Shigella sonnei]|nr:head-tail joining protein [Shigella sonnei]AWX18663.1 hypothetical protein CH310_15100 [Shigella sonnei]
MANYRLISLALTSPDDGGSCYLWLNRGQPPAVNRRR